MKASLYLLSTEAGWCPQWSISIEVDIDYWRSKQLQICEGGALERRITLIVGWNELLPLGIAEFACYLLGNKAELRERNTTLSRVTEILAAAVREVNPQEVPTGVPKVWVMHGDETDDLSLVSPRLCDVDRNSRMKLAEKIGERLLGHALLSDEMDAVLEDMLLQHGAEEIQSAIQLASLLKLVRLSAAVGIMELSDKQTRGRWKLAWLRNRIRYWREQELVIGCRRCGAKEKEGLSRSYCASCGHSCAYCEQCLTMGRTRECGLLILGMSESCRAQSSAMGDSVAQVSNPFLHFERWKLSPAQTEAAGEALRFIKRTLEDSSLSDRIFLLWAVTGAGKTEMIFPLIEEVVRSDGRVVVATPRKDVVLELAPRLAAAFPDTSLSVLYGGSSDRFGKGAITLATTHQLLRCYEAFDLVLIDELDAYPYHNNPMLHFAAAKSRKSDGVTVLLSATPPVELQRQVARGRLPHARVPVRYHLHPLPLPVRVALKPLSYWINMGTLPSGVLSRLQNSVSRGAQLFVFVPYIANVDGLVALIRGYAPQLGLPPDVVEGTSSKDTSRGDKVNAFRARTIRILVTTTILERGVTVPKSDVFILSADNPQFDCAALVQMAGRSGRSGDDPNGFVYFFSKHLTLSQKAAIRQISQMNRIAAKKGYLNRQEVRQ